MLRKQLSDFTASDGENLKYPLTTTLPMLAKDKQPNQGDGLDSLPIYDLESETLAQSKGMVISNSCDIDRTHERIINNRLMFCPILNLEKLLESLQKRQIAKEKIDSFASTVRKFGITNSFYLPKDILGHEAVIFFDQISNVPLDKLEEDISTNRLFCLSQFGFYLFLIKISIHFTRQGETLSRG